MKTKYNSKLSKLCFNALGADYKKTIKKKNRLKVYKI